MTEPKLVGLDGSTLSSEPKQHGNDVKEEQKSTYDDNGVRLTMPWIVSWQVTGVINARNEEEAKRGLSQKISVSAPMLPHLLEVVMDATPMPPEMLAEALAHQKGLKKV